MSLTSSALKFFRSEEEIDAVEEYSGPRLIKQSYLNIMVRTPRSFEDVREYADSLLNGKAILVSFESVDGALSNRIFDYLNGVSFICNAHVDYITDTMLIYAPKEVEVSKESEVKRSRVSSWIG